MFKWDDSVLRKASCLHCIVLLKTLIYAVVFNLFLFWVCVCVSELCNTWFPCCCEMEIFFVQLCEMFKGINSKQTSGFWVFLCPPLCPSSGSRWGMLQGIQNWGTVEWIDLASSNTTAIWGAPWHVPSLTAKYYFSGSFWIVVGFFLFDFTVTLWFAQSAGHTWHRQHDFAVENLLRTSLLGILLLCQSWLWIDVLPALWFHRFWCL